MQNPTRAPTPTLMAFHPENFTNGTTVVYPTPPLLHSSLGAKSTSSHHKLLTTSQALRGRETHL